MSEAQKNSTMRVTISVTKEMGLQILNCKKSGISPSELIRKALNVYNFFMLYYRSGHRFFIKHSDEEEMKEVIFVDI